MKIITLLAFALLSLNVFAQSQTEAEMIKTFMKAEKKALVAENMQLSDEKATAFWAIYDAYEVERSALSAKKGDIATMYVENFNNLDASKVDEIVNSAISNQMTDAKLMKKYYKKMKKELGEKSALRFFMIEQQIQLILKVGVWEQLPLVDTFQSTEH